jgi:TonB family protein
MRVLVVDQDSASNEAIARSLRELYTVDAVTNKGDCLDLLRSNTFEVIVATERLEDGSGLELLGQIAKKWPSVLRIFAADRQRLQLLKGRLGPFELFQTLTYPIDPDRLIATLNLAYAAQDANADTSNIQHVVLSGEPLAEAPEEGAQAAAAGESSESDESGEFPAPRPVPRAASMEPSQAAARVTRSPVRGGPSHRARSSPGQRSRGNGAAGPPTTRASAPSAARSAAHSPSLTPEGSGPVRHGRPRGGVTNKAPPVRFPPLERSPPLERIPPLEPPQGSTSRSSASQTDLLTEAAAMARAARSNFESPAEEFDTRHLTMMVGGGVAILVAVVVLGFKLFGSSSEAPHPAAPPVVRAPQYPQEVTDLVVQTESALKADDFKGARADVEQLRQLAPSHPRLAFFDSLLAQRSDASKGSASASAGGRGTAKRSESRATHERIEGAAGDARQSNSQGGQSSRRSGTGATPDGNAKTATVDSTAVPTSPGAPTGSAAAGESSATNAAGLAPETPPGLTRSSTASAATPPQHEPHAPESGSTPNAAAAGSTATAPAGSGPATAASPATAAGPAASAPSATATASSSPAPSHAASTSATRRTSAGEPPPVVREAKLIRSVTPDYPSAAKHDGIQGFVDLDVTVSSRGIVEDVSVVNATPPDMFEKSALAAVRKWKYDPRYVDGLPSQAHVKVHLEFGPGK